MPFKYNQSRRHHIKTSKYKINNWKKYNEALRQRGNITIWFDEKAIKNWYAKSNGKPCGQRTYSNVAIEAAALIRLVFRLPYRQTTGFMQSILKLMKLDLKIPDFSTLSRRIKHLNIRLSKPTSHKAGTHIIIDGSGLSVHGAKEIFDVKGEALVKRGFRRLHLAINEHQEITACELTTLHGDETKQVSTLLKRIHDHCEFFMADKNYDTQRVYKAIEKYRPTRFIRPVKQDVYSVVIPPQSNAKIRKYKRKFPLERSKHAAHIKEHGVISWQKATGYGKRSLVEVAFSRYKRILGKTMQCINFANQKVEAQLACKVLNIMSCLGMPETTRIS